MIITAINKDKTHLMRVCFENGSELLLDKDVCIENSLKCSDDISIEKCEELKYQSEYLRAKSRALWLLDRMDYTEKTLYSKLLKAGFGAKVCATVLARLTELGVVDDMRFAERFAERCKESNISKREMLQKMLQKGISYDMAKQVIAEIEVDEGTQLQMLIERKYAYKLSQPNGTEKVFAALVRKGFSYSDVREVLKKYIEETDFCEEY